MRNLKKLINYALYNTSIEVKEEELKRIRNEYEFMKKLLSNQKSVYGFNTMVGHKDNTKSKSNNYLDEILNSHLLGFGEEFSAVEVRFIIIAKILSWAAGHSGVSEQTFITLCKNANNNDFNPIIPKFCSYSSGDVIPATHLLNDYLKFNNCKQQFPSTDIMPFINGNFVQVGYCASLVTKIAKVWKLFIYGSLISSKIFNANNSNFVFYSNDNNLKSKNNNIFNNSKSKGSITQQYIKIIEMFQSINVNNKPIQDIVTIRSIPQQINQYAKRVQNYFEVIESCLSMPSGNPLFDSSYSDSISQASFLALDLTDCLLSMINAVKIFLVSIVNRISFMLSGKLEHIPTDGNNNEYKLGLIQVPKLLMSIEEKVSLEMPPASVYSAKFTSGGVEDLWNNGLLCADHLNRILKDTINIIKIEFYVYFYLFNHIDYVTDNINILNKKINFNSKIFISDNPMINSDISLNNFMKKMDGEYNYLSNNEFFKEIELL